MNYGTEEIGLGMQIYGGPYMISNIGGICTFNVISWYTFNFMTTNWEAQGGPPSWTIPGYWNDPSTACGAMFAANSQEYGGEVQINMLGPLEFGDSGTTIFDIDDPNCFTAIGSLSAIFSTNHNNGIMMDINNQVFQLNDFGQTGVQTGKRRDRGRWRARPSASFRT